MIYSASLFTTEHHHGELIPICRSLPRNVPQGGEQRLIKNHPLRALLAPSQLLLTNYKQLERVYQAEVDRLKAQGYSQPGTFLSHLEVCGSLNAALVTPEPELPPNPEHFYIAEYRQQIKAVLPQVLAELDILAKSGGDFTLLCWEKAGEFCHRNLVMLCVARWFPHVWGGLDVPGEESKNSVAPAVIWDQPLPAQTGGGCSKTRPPERESSPPPSQPQCDVIAQPRILQLSML